MSKKLKIYLPALVILSASVSASAADWSGFYLGGGFGDGHTRSDINYSHEHANACSNNNFGSNGSGCGGNQDFAKTFDNGANANVGSIDLGYNWNMNSYVVGVNSSINFLGDSEKTNFQIVSNAFGDTLGITSEQKAYSTLEASIGLPINNFLVYASGGAALGVIRTTIRQDNFDSGSNVRSFDETDIEPGLVVGAGAKYRLSDNWALGGQYSHLEFDTSKKNKPADSCCGGLNYPATQAKSADSMDMMMFTISYLFH